MAYWARKCTTWCAACDESFHKVWSWYDYPLPSYSVIVANTLRDLVTFDLLTLVSGHTWQVTWSTPPPSLKILRLSVLELWVLTSPIGYHWQCVCSHCTWAVTCDLCVGGKFSPHIWNPWPRFAYSLYNVHGATMTFKGRLHRRNRAPKWRFWGKGGVNVKVWFCDPKRHILARNRIFWHILCRCPWWRLGCGLD